jgi:hypothetical protein
LTENTFFDNEKNFMTETDSTTSKKKIKQATLDELKSGAATTATSSAAGQEKPSKEKKEKKTKTSKKKSKKSSDDDSDDGKDVASSDTDKYEPSHDSSSESSLSSSSDSDDGSSDSDESDSSSSSSSDSDSADTKKLKKLQAKLKRKRQQKEKEKKKKKSKKSSSSSSSKKSKKSEASEKKEKTKDVAAVATEVEKSSKNAEETEKRVPSQSPAVLTHATTEEKQVPAAPSKVPDTAPVASAATSKKGKAKAKPVVNVEIGPDGCASLDQLTEMAANMRNSTITDTELLAYMQKSEKHTAVILVAFLTEYVVLRERPLVTKSAKTSLTNNIAGSLKNLLEFDPNIKNSRLETLRSQTVALCHKYGLMVPPGVENEDPLLSKKEPVISEKDAKDGVTIEAIKKQRDAAKELNATRSEAMKKLSAPERAMQEFRRYKMLVSELLSEVRAEYMLPFLPKSGEKNLSTFVINAQLNNSLCDPFFLDKKGYGDFFGVRLFAAMIKTGSLVPMFGTVPAVCMLSLGHWLVTRMRSARNKKTNKQDHLALNAEIEAFQASLFYNDKPADKHALFRKLFPSIASEKFPSVDNFHFVENKIWERDTESAFPDRTVPRGKPKTVRGKRKANSDEVKTSGDKDVEDDEENGDDDDEEADEGDDGDDDDEADEDKEVEDSDEIDDSDKFSPVKAEETKKKAVATPPPPAPEKAPAKTKAKRGAGGAKKADTAAASLDEGKSREKILADRNKAPSSLAVEAAVFPELFHTGAGTSFTFKPADQVLIKEVGTSIDVLAPTRTLEAAELKFAVPTQEAHTTSAHSVSDKKKNKNKKKAQKKNGKQRRKKTGGDDDDDDDDDSDSDSDEEETAATMAVDAKSGKQPPSEAEIDYIAEQAHLEKQRVRHRFFEMSHPEMADDVNSDNPALTLKMDAAELDRFDAAREAMLTIPTEAVDYVLKGKWLAASKMKAKAAEPIVRFVLTTLWANPISLRLKHGAVNLSDVSCEQEIAAAIIKCAEEWKAENGGTIAVSDDLASKTRTVKKATITLESQRVFKPARGTLTLAGSITEGTAKMPAAKSAAWLSRKMSVEAIKPESALTTEDIRTILNAIKTGGGRVDAGTVARVLLDESLFMKYVLYALDKKYVAGELIDSDIDLSNLPLIGRSICASSTGFVEYTANCMILYHALTTLAEFFRTSSAATSSEEIENLHKAVMPHLPKKAFSPFILWQSSDADKTLKPTSEAASIADALLASLPPAIKI